MSCLNCKSKNFDSIIDLGKSPPSNFLSVNLNDKCKEYELKLVFCKKCKLTQQKKIIDSKKIFSKNYPYISSISKTWVKHCGNGSKKIISKFNLKKNDLVLEIASNDGTYLNFFKKKKMRVLGIEPALLPFQIANKNRIKTINNFFNFEFSKKLKKICPKVILANNVIAHVPNLNSFLKGIKNIIGDNVFICEFPYLKYLVKNNLIDTIYHEHYFYHSVEVFNSILKKNNLTAFDYDFINVHGGSIRLYIKSVDNKKFLIKRKIIKLIDNEIKTKLNSPSYLKMVDKKAQKNKIKIINFLLKLKKNKYKILGYGAAAKAVTMIKFLKINYKHIPFIIDRSSTKIGKFIPNTGIKIENFEFIKKFKPDFVIIFTWNIKNEIISSIRNKSYGKKIKFITLLPKIKID